MAARSLNLRSSWAKVMSARAHRSTLYKLEPRERDRPTVGVKFDEATGEHVIYVSNCPNYESLFPRVSLALGNCIQDLRSALDHLVYSLADWNTGGNIQRPNATQFPICDHPNNFWGEKGQAKLRLSELHPLHVLGIERLQPYNSLESLWTIGDYPNPLRALRDLSNEDKHRLLNVIVLPTGVSVFTKEVDVHDYDEFVGLRAGIGSGPNQVVELGAELDRIKRRTRLRDVEVIGYVGSGISLKDLRRTPWMVAFEIEWTVRNILWVFQPLCS